MKRLTLIHLLIGGLILTMATAVRAADKGGTIQLVFEDAVNKPYTDIQALLVNSERFPDLIDLINHYFALPHDIEVRFEETGITHYDPISKQIIITYKYVNRIKSFFAKADWIEHQEELEEAVLDTTEYALFHEMGHALIDALELPITSKEEDAAETLGIMMLCELLHEAVVLPNAAAYYYLVSEARQHIQEQEFADEHQLPEQRYYSIACWVYGSNPIEFEDVAQDAELAEERTQNCPAEYQQMVMNWRRLLAPHFKEKSRKREVESDQGDDRE